MWSKFGKGTLGAGYGFVFAGVYDAISFTGKARRGVWSLIATYLALQPSSYQSLRVLDSVEGETPIVTVMFESQHLDKIRELVSLLHEQSELVVDDVELERGRLKLQPPLDWLDRDPFPFPPIERDRGMSASAPDSRLMKGVQS